MVSIWGAEQFNFEIVPGRKNYKGCKNIRC